MSSESKSWHNRIGTIFSGLSLIVSVGAVVVSVGAVVVANRAYEHVTGGKQAQVAVKDVGSAYHELPPRYKFPDPSFWVATEATYLIDLDALIALNPTVTLENTGDLPIADIRTSTAFETGTIDMRHLPRERQLQNIPWAKEQVTVKDNPLTSKMLPGYHVTVPLLPGLLAQMLEVQSDLDADAYHYGIFRVDCSAKLVGASSFDAATPKATVFCKLAWKPSGFAREKSREYLQAFSWVARPEE